MTLDSTKLSPMPWKSDGVTIMDANGRSVVDTCNSPKIDGIDQEENERANLTFIVLARNDLDVKHRRGWHTEKCTEADQWFVPQVVEAAIRKAWRGPGDPLDGIPCPDDAFLSCYQDGHDVGLLTKADVWYTEHIEKEPV